MADLYSRQVDAGAAEAGASPFAPPQVNLPKGGGAIKEIGEKFATNPVTGTGNLSLPIALTPGRSGFRTEAFSDIRFRRWKRPVWFWLAPFSPLNHPQDR